ncbi:hypothetical protein LOK49_LG01G00912 [Camellia lanceoleosa]|uniref:Uncharacterized protein n=1 Tax=Camellia lanceoleosa TaxID=1840588 RepID=A0ACC0J0B2_9ERIC|nr:hypothetical protein LOK49_LG01G00912 [Camellia lanceoleosa]
MHRGSPRTIIRALSGELELEGCNMVQTGCVVSSSSSVRVVVTRALRCCSWSLAAAAVAGVGAGVRSAWSLPGEGTQQHGVLSLGVVLVSAGELPQVVAMEFSAGDFAAGGGRCGLFV